MNQEQLDAKKRLAGAKHPSMYRRADGHDYTARRIYMITMDTADRRPLFGRVVGDAAVPDGQAGAPRIELSPLGRAVQEEWLGIPRYYPQIVVVAVQMMPDHMHGILYVKEPLPRHLGQVISGFKAGCNKKMRALQSAVAKPQLTEKGALSSSSSSPQVAAKPQQRGSAGPLFASGYNDLILRSYDTLDVWKNYLRDNPRRLLLKHARPDLLRPVFGLAIGPFSCSAIGNRALLAAPWRVPVRVSRRLTGPALDAEVARYLAAARAGAVLVSPAISPGEKRVMRAAFDAGLPTIVIVENGFTPLSKPKGEQFYACAEGRLLMLAPWEHHNERQKLTAVQCQQMNLLAWTLSQAQGQAHEPPQHAHEPR